MRLLPLALAGALAIACVPGTAIAGHTGRGAHMIYIPYFAGTVPTVVPPAKTGDASGIKTVAVISAVGTRLTLGNRALFGTYKDIDTSDWNLDGIIETTLTGYLSRAFAVKMVPYNRAALAAIPNDHTDTDSAKPVHDFLATIPANGIDAFVVVRPDSEGQAPPTAGLSLVTSGYPRPTEIANYEIDIVDARSGAIISHALSRFATRQKAPPAFAAVYASPGLALTPADTPTDYQRALLKNDFARLIAVSLRETLRSLNLPIALPPVGARDLVPIPPEKAPLRRIHTVGVVSAIGDRLSMIHSAPFSPHSERESLISDWNLDGEIEAAIVSHLDKRYVVKPISADRGKLDWVKLVRDQTALSTSIDGLAPAADIDAYIVVMKDSTTPDSIHGVGLYNFGTLSGSTTTAIVNYVMMIVDAHTLKPFWIQRGITSPALPIEVPTHTIDSADWPPPGSGPTDDQARALHAAFSEIMNDSIPETMLRMTLTGMMVSPAPGVTSLAAPAAVTSVPFVPEAAAPSDASAPQSAPAPDAMDRGTTGAER